MAEIRFYLDENVPVVIAEQLKLRGIDAVTVRDLDLLGDTDVNHLEMAFSTSRVLCTHDADFIRIAMSQVDHSGIVFGQQDTHSVGD